MGRRVCRQRREVVALTHRATIDRKAYDTDSDDIRFEEASSSCLEASSTARGTPKSFPRLQRILPIATPYLCDVRFFLSLSPVLCRICVKTMISNVPYRHVLVFRTEMLFSRFPSLVRPFSFSTLCISGMDHGVIIRTCSSPSSLSPLLITCLFHA